MLFAAVAGCNKPDLPDYGVVPAFELVDQNEEKLTLEDLKGQVTIVDFIFTSCQTACPILTQQMKNAQARLGDDGIQYVSISVDPERDTPERLTEYADRFDVEWPFLTGPREDVRKLVVEGFKTAMGEVPAEDASLLELVHGERFVLVDRNAHIRGFYDVTTPEGRTALDTATRSLAN